jgi:hypothetical protein
MTDEQEDVTTVMNGSEMEDDDGHLYRVTGMDERNVYATCFYPRHNNELLYSQKTFSMAHAKELILRRL